MSPVDVLLFQAAGEYVLYYSGKTHLHVFFKKHIWPSGNWLVAGNVFLVTRVLGGLDLDLD